MNIELVPDVQFRMKHPVSGLNEFALIKNSCIRAIACSPPQVPFRKEKESSFYRQSLPVPVAPN